MGVGGRGDSRQRDSRNNGRKPRRHRDRTRPFPTRIELRGAQKHARQQAGEHEARTAGARTLAKSRTDGLSAAVEGARASQYRLARQTRCDRSAGLFLASLPALQPEHAEEEHGFAAEACRRAGERACGGTGSKRNRTANKRERHNGKAPFHVCDRMRRWQPVYRVLP